MLIKRVTLFLLVGGLAFNLQKTSYLHSAINHTAIKRGMPVYFEVMSLMPNDS